MFFFYKVINCNSYTFFYNVLQMNLLHNKPFKININYIANIHEKSDKNKFCVIFIIREALVNIKVTKMK